jgi:hypothetical protein
MNPAAVKDYVANVLNIISIMVSYLDVCSLLKLNAHMTGLLIDSSAVINKSKIRM